MAVVAAIEEAAEAAEVAVGIAIRGDSHFAAIARGSQGKRRKNRINGLGVKERENGGTKAGEREREKEKREEKEKRKGEVVKRVTKTM
nr:hypothetical protein Iba_chr03fCG4610 [Ipomoea batatas]